MALGLAAYSATTYTSNVAASATVVSSTFSPAAGDVIFCVGFCDNNLAQLTENTPTNSGTALTWHLVKRENTFTTSALEGSLFVYWAYNAAAQTSITVTVNSPVSTAQLKGVAVIGFTAADSAQTGAVSVATAYTAANTTPAAGALTTSAAGSWIWMAGWNWTNFRSGLTAHSGQSFQISPMDASSNGDTEFLQKENPQPASNRASGTVVTMSDTGGTASDQYHLVAWEIVPAAGGAPAAAGEPPQLAPAWLPAAGPSAPGGQAFEAWPLWEGAALAAAAEVDASVAGTAAAAAVAASAGATSADANITGIAAPAGVAGAAGAAAADANLTGVAAAITVASPTGTPSAGANLTGIGAPVTTAGGQGAATAGGAANVAGIAAPVAVACPAGVLSAAANITALAAAVAVASPAGMTSAGANITGVAPLVTVAAPAGVVSGSTTIAAIATAPVSLTGPDTLPGLPGGQAFEAWPLWEGAALAAAAEVDASVAGTAAAVAVASPAGLLSSSAAATGTGAPVAVAGGTGAASAPVSVTGTAAHVTTASPAGTGAASVNVTGAAALVLAAAPAGTLAAAAATTGTAALITVLGGQGIPFGGGATIPASSAPAVLAVDTSAATVTDPRDGAATVTKRATSQPGVSSG